MQSQLDKSAGQLSRVQKEKENIQQEMDRIKNRSTEREVHNIHSIRDYMHYVDLSKKTKKMYMAVLNWILSRY